MASRHRYALRAGLAVSVSLALSVSLSSCSCQRGCDNDGVCDPDETAGGCPEDCSPPCDHDEICEERETRASCPDDCANCDHDGVCDPGGETAASCPDDCALAGEVTERFVVIGDSGHPGPGQARVSEAIAAACLARGGCDYGIMNGDNVYRAGVSSEDDPRWATHLEASFGGLGFPFHASLGNHDYGGVTESDEIRCDFNPLATGSLDISSCLAGLGNAIQNRGAESTGGIGLDPSRAEHQVRYAATHSAFDMPATHYTFSTALIDFVAIDTSPIYWDDANEDGDQRRLQRLRQLLEELDADNAPIMFRYAGERRRAQEAMLQRARAESSRRWRIVFGHHPYLSNGQHRNAGSYNGTGDLEGDGLPFGTQLKAFLERYVVGAGYHAYLYGHDHNLQDLGEATIGGQARGAQMLLSGAASKVTGLRRHARRALDDADNLAQNDALFESACFGFLMIEATLNALHLLFITAPTDGAPSCGSDTFTIRHERTVSFYEPG